MRRHILTFVRANGVLLPIIAGVLALGQFFTTVLSHPFISIAILLVIQCVLAAGVWLFSEDTSDGNKEDFFRQSAFQREKLTIRFATSDDFPGTERIFLEWFSDSLSIDDSEFCEIMSRRQFVRVAEETLTAGSQHATRIVGYYSVWPLQRATLDGLINGSIKEDELDSSSIMEFSDPNSSTAYVSEICVEKRSDVGAALLRDMLRYVPYALRENPHILSVSAWPYTKAGRRLVKAFKMKPQTNKFWGRKIYELSRAAVLNSPTVPKTPFSPRWSAKY